MEYVITESQLFKTMGKLFDTLYPRTRYKKTKTKWYVYHGDKLSTNYDYSNNGHKDPSVIMEYYPNKDLLKFINRNTIPNNLVVSSRLLQRLLDDKNIQVVNKDDKH